MQMSENVIEWDKNKIMTKNEPLIKVVADNRAIVRKYDDIKKPELVQRLLILQNVNIPPKYRLLQMKRGELRQLLIIHTRQGADIVQPNENVQLNENVQPNETKPAEVIQANENVQPNETKPEIIQLNENVQNNENVQPNETKPAEIVQNNENVQQDETKPAEGVKLPMTVRVNIEAFKTMKKWELVDAIENDPHIPFITSYECVLFKKGDIINIIEKYINVYNYDDEETQNKKYESMKILKETNKSEREKRKAEAEARRECMEINAKINESMKQRELMQKEKDEAQNEQMADAIAQTILLNRELEYNINHATKCINDLIKFVEYAKSRMT